MHKQRAFIGHHGPELLDDGTTRFRIWAPDAQNVSLIVVGAQTLPMTANEDGWYSIDAPYGAGTLYRFLIDDELQVPDPASRAQAGDVHAPSLVVDTSSNYLWAQPELAGPSLGGNRPLRDARRAVRRLRRHGKTPRRPGGAWCYRHRADAYR